MGWEEGGEEVKGGKEMAGNEEGLLSERERVEVVKGVREEGGGGEKGGESAVVAVEG